MRFWEKPLVCLLAVAAMGLLRVARCEESVRKKVKNQKNRTETEQLPFSSETPGMQDAAGTFRLVTAREEQLFSSLPPNGTFDPDPLVPKSSRFFQVLLHLIPSPEPANPTQF